MGLQPKARSSLARSSLARSSLARESLARSRWRGVPAAAAAAAGMAIPARSSLARSRWRGVRWRGVVGAEFVGAEFRLQPRRLLVWGCSRRRGVGLLVWPSRRGVRWRGVPAAAAAGCWYIINWAAGMGLQPKARSRAAGMGLQPKARSSLARSSLARSSLVRSSGCSRRRGVRWRGVVGAEFRLQPRRLLVWGCSRRRGVGLLVWPSRRGVRWRGVRWRGVVGAEFRLQPKARSSLARSSLARSRAAAAAGCWYGAAAEGAESLARSSGCSRRRGVGLLVWPSRRGVPAAAAAGCWYIINWAADMGLQPKARSSLARSSGAPCPTGGATIGAESLARSRWRGVRWRGVPAAAAAGCWYIINWAAGMGLQPKARSSLARSRWRGVPAAAEGAESGCWYGAAAEGAESLARKGSAIPFARQLGRHRGYTASEFSAFCPKWRHFGQNRTFMHQRRGVPAAAAAGCWYIINWAAGMGLQPKARSSLARSRWRGVGLLVWGCSRRRGVRWRGVRWRGVRWRGVPAAAVGAESGCWYGAAAEGAEFVGAESLARSRWRGVPAAAEGAESGCWYGHPGAEFVGAEFRLQQPPAAGISLIGLLVWGCSRRRGVRWRGVVGAEFVGAESGCWYGAADMAIPARSSGAPCPTGGATIGAEFVGAEFVGAEFVGAEFVGAEFVGAEFRLQQPPAAGISLIGLLVWGCSRRRGVGLLVWGCSRRRGVRWRGVVGAEVVGAEFRLQPRRLLVWGCSRRRGVGLLVWPSRRGVRWRGVVGAEFRLQQPPAAGMAIPARSSLARSSGCSRRRGVRWRGVVGAESLARSRWRGVPARLAPPVGQRLARSRWRGVPAAAEGAESGCWYGAAAEGAEFVGAEFRLQQPPAAGISLIGLLVWGCSRRRGVRWRGVVGAESLARSRAAAEGAESLARSRAAGMGLQPKARSRWRGVPAAAEGAESGCWYGHPGAEFVGAESLARSRWRGVPAAAAAAAGMGLQPKARSRAAGMAIPARSSLARSSGCSSRRLLVWGC